MLLGLVNLGGWLLLRLGAWRPNYMGLNPVRVALSLFIFSVGLSYVLAMSQPINSDEVSPADVAILSLLSWAGTLLVASGISRMDRLNTLVWRLAVAGGLLGILGIAQFVTRSAIVDVINVPGLTAVREALPYFRDGRIRPSGTAIHPLEYGTILSLLLPLALHVAFHHRSRSVVVRWIPALAIGGVIAISSSRTAYLSGLLAVLICVVGWTARQRRIVLAVAVGGTLALMAVTPRLINSVIAMFTGAADDPSVESRTDSMGVAWKFLGEHPILGRGLGTFLPKYRIFDNQYLLLLVSVGIVGTALFVGVLLTSIVQLVRAYRSTKDQTTRDLSISLVAAIMAGALSLAFFDAFAFPMTMGTLFLIVGIGCAFTRQILTQERRGMRFLIEEQAI